MPETLSADPECGDKSILWAGPQYTALQAHSAKVSFIVVGDITTAVNSREAESMRGLFL